MARTQTISIRELIVNGTLGGVHPGMSRGEVRSCLGEPDDWMAVRRGPSIPDRSPIWRYGNFEVHFDRDGLVDMLFLDYLKTPDAGEGRALDPWLMQALPDHTPESVRAALEDRGVAFEAFENALGVRVLRVEGGAELWFNEFEGEWFWGSISAKGPPDER